MALGSIMQNALTGLFTSQASLSVTANNIANVNTPNYAREVAVQEPVVNGTYGGGVKIAKIQTIVDQFLSAASLKATADNSQYTVEQQYQNQLQAVLGDPSQSTSLSGQIDTMFNNISNLELNPSDSVQKQSVVSGIQNFTSNLSNLAGQIQTLRSSASGQISSDITTVNAALQQIATLNPEIIKSQMTGQDTSALEGQRSQALAQLSKYMDIRSTDNGDGSITVTTGGGVNLVNGSVAYSLQYNPPSTVTAGTSFSPITLTKTDPATGQQVSTGVQLDGSIQSGELRGLLDLRDTILPNMADQLGQLGGRAANALNGVSNTLTALPAPSQLSGTNSGLLSTDLQGFTGKATFAVVGSDGTVAAKTTVDFSSLPAGSTINDVVNAVNAGLGGAGTLSFTNGVMSLTATNPANGVVIAQDTTTPSSRAGQGFSQFFGMNNLVQASVPTNFNTGVQGTGASGFTPGGTIDIQLNNSNNTTLADYTLTIPAGATFNTLINSLNTSTLGQYATFSLDSNGALQVTPQPGYSNLKINVPSDTTARGTSQRSFSSFFGLGDQYVAGPALSLSVNPAISSNPSQIPLVGFNQGAGVGQVAISAGDQSGAMAYQALQNTNLSFSAIGGLSAFSGTLTQYGAAFLANAGQLAATATTQVQDSSALQTQINQQMTSVSGVNLDEELSNMITYQNAYNASAKMISTVQSLYTALLQVLP